MERSREPVWAELRVFFFMSWPLPKWKDDLALIFGSGSRLLVAASVIAGRERREQEASLDTP